MRINYLPSSKSSFSMSLVASSYFLTSAMEQSAILIGRLGIWESPVGPIRFMALRMFCTSVSQPVS